ncbi:selenoprotein H-like [Panicum virgatum]|nr:selenoprotein H-like [Panicum virgatum]
MPPKRKSPAAAAPAAGSPRKTRSVAAAGKRGAEAAPAKAVPAKKKEVGAAVAEQKGRKRAKKDEAVTAAAEPKGRKRGKKEAEEAAPAEENEGDAVAEGKRVIVEACTQCRQFKIRAQKVKEDLENSVPGVSVIINPQKPRRGCLEIREEGGEVFISLLNMPRPFTPMKKLDMDEVIKDIAKKIS